jgi:ActR/RegA family two-component response regulator
MRAYDDLLPVVVMTGWSSVETAVEAMRRGARNFVCKPWNTSRWRRLLRRAVALDASHLALTIGDVCGKGLPAALLMTYLQASARAFASARRRRR